MPIAFLLFGSAFVIAGVRGTDDQLLNLLKGDFSGEPNFISWMLALLFIGAVGYIEPLKPISRAFLVLVILVLIVHNGGFFKKFQQQTQPSGA